MTHLRAVTVTAGGRHRQQEKATIIWRGKRAKDLAGTSKCVAKDLAGPSEVRGKRFGGNLRKKCLRHKYNVRLESMEVGGHAFIHYL